MDSRLRLYPFGFNWESAGMTNSNSGSFATTPLFAPDIRKWVYTLVKPVTSGLPSLPFQRSGNKKSPCSGLSSARYIDEIVYPGMLRDRETRNESTRYRSGF